MKLKSLPAVFAAAVSLLALSATLAQANCPAGWGNVSSGKAVRLCQKGALFVQRIDLSGGARIRLVYEFANGAGSSGNPNPWFKGRDINEWLAYATSNNGNNVVSKPSGALYSMVSSAFFDGDYYGDPQQRPAYPIKNRGGLLSIGNQSGQGQPLREFRMNDSDANIVYYPENPREWNQTHAKLGTFTSVVGLHPGNQDDGRTGRTYIGLRDNNRDGKYEWVMILSTNNASKAEVYAALNTDFGSSLNIQFDGSGTAQMVSRNTEYVKSSDPLRRNFPLAFAIYEAP
jgi:hypothetical protein